MNIERRIDTKQILQSAAAVGELIEQEIARGIASENIFIAGFSQGGAVAYETALSYSKPLGGVIALSTYFATNETIDMHPANSNIPIFIGHGSIDQIVPEILGRQALQTLTEANYQPEYYHYPIAHSVSMPEIHDISVWLQKQINARNSQAS